jgi:hypothetical protein
MKEETKMTIMINGRKVLVDGIQSGTEYSSHETAIHQGQKIREKHYPNSNFVVIPEVAQPIKKKKSK